VTDLCRDCALEALFLLDYKKIGKPCKLDNITLFDGEFGSRCILGKLEICCARKGTGGSNPSVSATTCLNASANARAPWGSARDTENENAVLLSADGDLRRDAPEPAVKLAEAKGREVHRAHGDSLLGILFPEPVPLRRGARAEPRHRNED